MASYSAGEVPIIVRGEGAYVWDAQGRRYLDGLAGLFVVNAGHGRTELAEAAAKQAGELAYFPLWSYAHPKAIELAERIAALDPRRPQPGLLHHRRLRGRRGGVEAGPRVLQAHRQAQQAQGDQPLHRLPRHLDGRPVDHRPARHQERLRAAGAGRRSRCRTPTSTGRPSTATTPEAFGRWAADEIGRAIEREGPDTVAAVFLEPVQNSGGCFPPPPGYFQRVREICDAYDVLLVSDEVICSWGRLGEYFGAVRYGYQPDIITTAKGITSGYAPLGAMIASDRLMEPFLTETGMFAHGVTFGGHPVSCAVALANLEVFAREDLVGHVRANEDAFRSTLEKLHDLPIVGDVRGDGYFYGIELVKDKTTRETFNEAESERLLRGFLSTPCSRPGSTAGPTTGATRSSSWPHR